MIIAGIQCEMCAIQHIHKDSEKSFPGYVPPTWLRVIRGTMIEPLHFCSIDCLHQWTEKKISTSNDKPRVDHDPYELCCAVHYPFMGMKESHNL